MKTLKKNSENKITLSSIIYHRPQMESDEMIPNNDIWEENTNINNWYMELMDPLSNNSNNFPLRKVSNFTEKEGLSQLTSCKNLFSAIADLFDNGWSWGDPSLLAITLTISILMLFGFWQPQSPQQQSPTTTTTTPNNSILSPPPPPIFAARLSMEFLSFAMIFPVTFMSYVLFKRRDDSLMLLSEYKANLLQFLTLILMSRQHPNNNNVVDIPEMTPQTEINITKATHLAFRSIIEILATSNAEYSEPLIVTKIGQIRKLRYKLRYKTLLKRYTLSIIKIRLILEECKQLNIVTSIDMLESYFSSTTRRAERLLLLKRYPGPLLARAFFQVYFVFGLIFMSPYFTSIVGPFTDAYTGLWFMIALIIISVIVMDLLSHFHLALEDFYCSRFRGDTARLTEDVLDFNVRLEYVLSMARSRRVVREQQQQQQQQQHQQ
jgi:hypothetical protein